MNPLPSGEFVRVERFGDCFRVVTIGPSGGPVGPRLDRGKGIYPTCKTTCSTIVGAMQAMRVWDSFCKLNKRTK